MAAEHGLALAPRLATVDAADVPTGIDKMHAFLGEHLPQTTVALDGEPGRPEGIVLRAADRSAIAKARFQDYERTMKRRSGKR